jgi:drug/metabolite transporter (DMT)-like permease
LGILFGVAAAICWGLGDYLITHLTRRIGTARALISIQLLSLAAWALLLFGQPSIRSGDLSLWLIVLGTAICHVLGLMFVYRAFEIGTLSIVSPISSAFAVVTAVLSLASGERPPAIALGGALLLILGVVLATRSAPSSETPRAIWRGVPEAIASALAFGTMFWLFYFFVQPKLGYVVPLILLKTMAVGSSVLVFLPGKRGEKNPRRALGLGVILLAIGAAAADTLAWLAYIWGTSTTYATVVTALASLFSVVTVLLAWRFLRERLAIHQWAGVAVILLGILLVSF